MNFAWPWLALILPLFWLLPRSRTSASAEALEHPYLMSLSQQQPPGRQRVTRAGWLLQVAWVLLVVALIRPQWVGEPVSNVIAGRSIFLAVDLSGSMLEPDMTWNGRAIERYQAVQAVVGQFVEQRRQDFIGRSVWQLCRHPSPLDPRCPSRERHSQRSSPGHGRRQHGDWRWSGAGGKTTAPVRIPGQGDYPALRW